MEKNWTVYILECGDSTLYTGITDNFSRRFQAHKDGKGAKYTRGRGPLTLRYREEVPDKSTALKRECALKRLRKSEKMALIAAGKTILEIMDQNQYTNSKKIKNEEE